jgi:putative chitinase
VRRLHALQGWTGAGSQDEARYYDMGAITLDCDVGGSTGWFGLRAVEDGALPPVVVVQGYPVDKDPGGRQWWSKGSVKVAQELNLFYDDDTFGGMSGAPVLAAGAPEVVAVHTNGLHNGEPWSTWNGSTRLTAERLRMIARWIAE